MGYNYSHDFFYRNIETVKSLQKLAQDQGVVRMAFATVEEMQNYQRLINNLCASAQILGFDPDLRKMVRSWTNYENGEWVLRFGAPKHKVTGRPPRIHPGAEAWTHEYTRAAPITSNKTVSFDRLIHNVQDLLKLATFVQQVPDSVQEVVAEFADEISDLSPFEGFVQLGWTPSVPSPTRLVLTKVVEKNHD
jgi:hypothetical protein